jgi:hypothetical protein
MKPNGNNDGDKKPSKEDNSKSVSDECTQEEPCSPVRQFVIAGGLSPRTPVASAPVSGSNPADRKPPCINRERRRTKVGKSLSNSIRPSTLFKRRMGGLKPRKLTFIVNNHPRSSATLAEQARVIAEAFKCRQGYQNSCANSLLMPWDFRF